MVSYYSRKRLFKSKRFSLLVCLLLIGLAIGSILAVANTPKASSAALNIQQLAALFAAGPITITVEEVADKDNTYRATDDHSTTTTWHYKILFEEDAELGCSSYEWDRDSDPETAYTEGANLTIRTLNLSHILCFRATKTIPVSGHPSVIAEFYGSITLTDNHPPAITIFDAPTPKIYNIANIGDQFSVTIVFNELVVTDKNGGDGPRIRINTTPEGRWIYANSRSVNVASGSKGFFFDITVQAGDNVSDLDVLEVDANGATFADLAGNAFTFEDWQKELGGFAARHEIMIDTEAPLLEISEVSSGNTISLSISDNLDSGPYKIRWTAVVEADNCPAGDAPGIWGTYITAQSHNLPLGVGIVVCYEVVDLAGNEAYARSGAGKDTTPPTVTTDQNSDDASAKREITITGSSPDTDVDASTWQHKNIGGSATCDEDVFTISYSTGASFTLDNEAYNGNKVCFRVQDDADNWGYGASGVITNIDTTKPKITVGAVTNDTVSATASDNQASSFTLTFESVVITDTVCSSTTTGLATYVGSTALTLAAGSRACFKATDEAGNTRYVASGSNGDTTPPTITVTPASDDATAKREITVSASSTDSDVVASSWKYKVIAHDDTCDAAEMTASTVFSGTYIKLNNDATDNNVKVCFFVKDTSDNPQYAVSGIITGIDSTAPTITISPEPSSSDYSDPKTTITISASSTDSDMNNGSWLYKEIAHDANCDKAQMSTDNFGGGNGSPLTYASEGHNNFKLCFSVRDNLGNTRYAASGVITNIDRTEPVIRVSSVSSSGIVTATVSDNQASSLTLTIEALGIAGTATCDSTVTNFQAYTPGTSSVSLGVGQKACFKAEDAAGNLAYTASLTRPAVVLADTIPPTITVTPSNADPSPKQQILVQAFATEHDVDHDSWIYKLIGATNVACDQTTMSSATSAGRTVRLNSQAQNNHKVCFGVKDTSNNWDYAASGVITGLDNQAPLITINSGAEINQLSAQVSDNQDSNPSFEVKTLADNEACDPTTSGFTSYTAGTVIELAAGSRVCFKATDAASNTRYAAPGAGIDITPATIDVSEVVANQVSATLSGNLANRPSLSVAIITGDTCDGTTETDFSDYNSGDSLALEVAQRACFRAIDIVGNVDYALSTAAVAVVVKPQLVVRVTAADTISASDNYDQGLTTMSYLITSSNTCNHSLTGFKAYQEGYVFTPTEATATRYVCFRSVESADATNVAYASAQLVASQTPPETPPVETETPAPTTTTSEIPDLSDDETGSLSLAVIISLLVTTVVLVFVLTKIGSAKKR